MMNQCKATTNDYNHKEARKNMSINEKNEILLIVQKQYYNASINEPIDCAGDNCHVRLIPFRMFRCFFCGRYFCPKCSKFHFGDRPSN